jgi:hypothetical protein
MMRQLPGQVDDIKPGVFVQYGTYLQEDDDSFR